MRMQNNFRQSMELIQRIQRYLWTLFVLVGIAVGVQIQLSFGKPPAILWKDKKAIEFFASELENEPLQKAMQRFIDQYATHPQEVFIIPSVTGVFTTPRLKASSAETGFQWLLSRYELSTLFKEKQWWILPKKEVWLHQSYRKLIASPLSFEHILDDLAKVGQIKVIFDRDQAKPLRIQNNLIHSTVKAAVEELARQMNWFIKYDPSSHVIHLLEEREVETLSLILENVGQKRIQQFLEEAEPLANDLRQLEIFFPSEHVLMAKGQNRRIETVFSAVKNFDQAHSSTPQIIENHFESILLESDARQQIEQHLQSIVEYDVSLSELKIKWQEEKEVEFSTARNIVSLYGEKKKVQKLAEIIKKLDQTYLEHRTLIIDRVDLNYLHVKARKIVNEGETITNEGVEVKLQQIFQKLLKDQKNKEMQPLQMIPDFVGNAMILRGTPEQVRIAKQILKIWDQPHPLIKIEAHIFETSDTVSRDLGLQFSAQGIPEGGDAPNAVSSGIFTAGAVLGPLQTTKAFQVDTLLRFIESEGNGRVLSRPVVVTTNNIEAEMRSGDIINVKVVIDNKPTLKEIKTGVILRVTPRLIRERKEDSVEHKIQLKVFAESSTPINETVDNIPRINSQSARSEVVVSNGEPFLLGGLIRSNASESDSGVPFLKDIPLLGYLFKVDSINNRFNHILVFVTPSIILPDEKQALPEFPEVENTPLFDLRGSQSKNE